MLLKSKTQIFIETYWFNCIVILEFAELPRKLGVYFWNPMTLFNIVVIKNCGWKHASTCCYWSKQFKARCFQNQRKYSFLTRRLLQRWVIPSCNRHLEAVGFHTWPTFSLSMLPIWHLAWAGFRAEKFVGIKVIVQRYHPPKKMSSKLSWKVHTNSLPFVEKIFFFFKSLCQKF